MIEAINDREDAGKTKMAAIILNTQHERYSKMLDGGDSTWNDSTHMSSMIIVRYHTENRSTNNLVITCQMAR